MADQAGLSGVDQAIPNVAGMWDYYLGGNENTDAGLEAARLVLGAAPDVPLAALENREFLKHAVRFLAAESGIRQFLAEVDHAAEGAVRGEDVGGVQVAVEPQRRAWPGGRVDGVVPGHDEQAGAQPEYGLVIAMGVRASTSAVCGKRRPSL